VTLWGYYLILMHSWGGGILTLILGCIALQGLIASQLAAYVYCGLVWRKRSGRPERVIVIAVTSLLVAPVDPFGNELVFGSTVVALHLVSLLCMIRLIKQPDKTDSVNAISFIYWVPLIIGISCIPWYVEQTRYMIS
jgi:hypothetical protein